MINNNLISKGQFRTLWFSQLVTILGSGMTSFGINIYIYNLTNQTTPLAISIMCTVLPYLIFSPFVGYFSDKYNKKNLILISDSFAALVSVLLLLVIIWEIKILYLFYALIFLSTTCNMINATAFQSSVPMVVEKDDLKKANGLNQISESAQTLLVPALTGALFSQIDMVGIITIDLLSFLVSIIILCQLDSKKFDSTVSNTSESVRTILFQNINEGYKFIFSNKGLALLLIVFSIVNFLNNLCDIFITPMVMNIGSAANLGLVQTSGGLGMLLGSLYILIHNSKRSFIKRIQWGQLIAALILICFGFQHTTTGFAVLRFVYMFLLPVINATAITLWQQKTPFHLQGRVFSARQLFIRILMPFSYIIAGPLSDRLLPNLINKYANYFSNLTRVFDERIICFQLIYIGCGILLSVIISLFYRNGNLKSIETQIPDIS